MFTNAGDLARGLARNAEAVCRYYLSNGRRVGRYWIVGDVHNTPGRSMFVRLTGGEAGLSAAGKWADGASAERGDLLDVIRETCGYTRFRDVAEEARRFLSLPSNERDRASVYRNAFEPARPADSARRLFNASRPVSGTLAEAYLRHRGIMALHAAERLRFHPRCYYRTDDCEVTEAGPAMITAVTNLDRTITGVHRTWLDPSGLAKAAVETPRRALGDLLGNAVRFGVAPDVLAAGEGIETMLSLRCALPAMPVAATLSASNLIAILFPATLRRIYIARDNDPAGDNAAAKLADRASAAGIEALVLSPRLGDFNEDLCTLGLVELRAALRAQLAPEDVARFMKPPKT
jgi:phage/plasmid primase-like uncharacterized protein